MSSVTLSEYEAALLYQAVMRGLESLSDQERHQLMPSLGRLAHAENSLKRLHPPEVKS